MTNSACAWRSIAHTTDAFTNTEYGRQHHRDSLPVSTHRCHYPASYRSDRRARDTSAMTPSAKAELATTVRNALAVFHRSRTATQSSGTASGAAEGRESIAPRLIGLFERARARELRVFADSTEIVETYIALLIGDLQSRRVIGAMAPLPDAEIEHRARRASGLIRRLYTPVA